MLRGRPIAIDLFCGLGGWTEALLAEGYYVVGFDVEHHVYGADRYPGQLVIQDVLTLDGRQFRDAALIVASPPCTEYSYMAMPWSRAKQIASALRGDGEFPEGYKGSRTVPQLTALFEACFRIQREASEAAGRHIPLVVENVKGAQPWVGRAAWNFGSFYLWGDVPALMPITLRDVKLGSAGGRTDQTRIGSDWTMQAGRKNPGFRFDGSGKSFQSESVNRHTKNAGGSWFSVAHNTTSGVGQNPDGRKVGDSKPASDGVKDGSKRRGSGHAAILSKVWAGPHGSTARKAASARIAKIPYALAQHVARCYAPESAP